MSGLSDNNVSLNVSFRNKWHLIALITILTIQTHFIYTASMVLNQELADCKCKTGCMDYVGELCYNLENLSEIGQEGRRIQEIYDTQNITLIEVDADGIR